MTDEQENTQAGTKELAMVTKVAYGFSEENGVGLVFGLQLLGGSTVLFMDGASVTELLIETRLTNIMLMQGRPCSVNVDPNKVVSFDKLI